MIDLLDVQNYRFQWLSLPYLAAAMGLMAMGLYVLVTKGALLLRASFLVVCAGLLPVMASYALAGSTLQPEVALSLYKFGLALVPTAAAGVLAFEAVLASKLDKYGWLIVVAFVISLLQAIPALTTDLYISGVWETSLGLLHFEAGPLAPLQLGSIGLWGVISGYLVRKQLGVEQSELRRRQLKGSMIAFMTFALSVVDTLLAYRIGSYPFSWLFFSAGVVILFRSLVIDDLIHSRTLDRNTPLIFAYMCVAAVGLWLVWRTAGSESLLLLVLLSMAVYLSLRVAAAFIQIANRPHAGIADTPLDRVLEQYGWRIQGLHSESEIATCTAETISVGVGCDTIELLMPSANNWAWETVDGEVLSEEATPHPLTVSWLMDHARPLPRSDLPGMHLEDFREPVEMVFEANRAEVILPLVSRDEMVGLLILRDLPHKRSLAHHESRFLEKVQEHLTAALVYARMHREANAQVALDQQIELAAAIQSAFVSSADIIDCGSVQVSGLWAPATQCGGDWWSVHQLPDGRVLVLIGDVTGHGVAAAMVTAAAKGCYDVVQRLKGDELDLSELLDYLDTTVRLVGADQFHMTCFATLLDPANGKVTYANAGHVAPYVCRKAKGGGIELGALVARGNPLGAGDKGPHKARHKELVSGDILVWYTDGIVECTNSDQNQFGDRRMQRLLRKLDQREPNARGVRDHIVRAVAAFQAGQPPDDDITLVVARVA